MLNWNDVLAFAANGNPSPDKRVEKTEKQWKEQLTVEQFYVTRKHGVKHSFVHDLCQIHSPGLYACVCSNTLLFDFTVKFDSGTSWPSFKQPIKENSLKYIKDDSFGMARIEAQCNVCDAHLGYVFPDGPAPSGLRYCINRETVMNRLNLDDLIPFLKLPEKLVDAFI